MRQAQRAPGFLAGAVGRDPGGGYWTVTIWADEAAMRSYRITGAHKKAMPKLLDWCDEAAVAHWEQETDALPSGGEVLQRMQTQGRISKVRHPSPAHALTQTAPVPGPPQLLRRFNPMRAPAG